MFSTMCLSHMKPNNNDKKNNIKNCTKESTKQKSNKTNGENDD